MRELIEMMMAEVEARRIKARLGEAAEKLAAELKAEYEALKQKLGEGGAFGVAGYLLSSLVLEPVVGAEEMPVIGASLLDEYFESMKPESRVRALGHLMEEIVKGKLEGEVAVDGQGRVLLGPWVVGRVEGGQVKSLLTLKQALEQDLGTNDLVACWNLLPLVEKRLRRAYAFPSSWDELPIHVAYTSLDGLVRDFMERRAAKELGR